MRFQWRYLAIGVLWGLTVGLLGGSALFVSGDMFGDPGSMFAKLAGPFYGLIFFAASLAIGIFSGIVLALGSDLDVFASRRSLKLAAKCAGASVALATLIVAAVVTAEESRQREIERDVDEHLDDFFPIDAEARPAKDGRGAEIFIGLIGRRTGNYWIEWSLMDQNSRTVIYEEKRMVSLMDTPHSWIRHPLDCEELRNLLHVDDVAGRLISLSVRLDRSDTPNPPPRAGDLMGTSFKLPKATP